LRVEIGMPFSARCLVDFVGRRVQSADSEGPSSAERGKRNNETGTAAIVGCQLWVGGMLTGSGMGSGTGKELMGVTQTK